MLRGLSVAVLLCLALWWATADELSVPESTGHVGVPYDWTHRHQVFSQPETFDRMREVESEPRYWHQIYRTMLAVSNPPVHSIPIRQALKPDWGMSLGTSSLSFPSPPQYPAKYTFNVSNPSPSCTNDYVVFTLPNSSSSTINIVGFNNLYVDNAGTGLCSGTAPTAIFAYNASQNSGKLDSSPVLSLDGTRIAFTENASSAQFHVLKWESGNVSATFGAPFNSSAMANCATNGAVAPCEYSVTYSTTTSTKGSPYVDYTNDVAYVTDDAGKVSAITPVFKGGTPAVKTGYPITVAGSTNMTSPVYDSVSKNLFVADKKGKLYYIRTAATSSGTCSSGTPPCLGATSLTVTSNKEIFEAPLVDSTSGTVFVFANAAATGSNSTVTQASTTLGNSKVATIGQATTSNVYAGTFNNAYLSNPSTGLLYVCGAAATTNIPQLYAISFTGTTMNAGAAAHGPLALGTATATCSPLTEVYNQASSGNADLLYVGVSTKCTASVTVGCIESFNITSGFPTGTAVTPVAEDAGTSGIVVDNVANGSSATANQANIYFVTQATQSCTKYTSGGGTNATGNCAVKLTQTGLQ